MRIFLSKETDTEEIKQFEEITAANRPMFLDETINTPKIAFASLMRSGNTFYRRLFEEVTGVASGSNIELMSSPQLGFFAQGFHGESIYNDRCFMLKTHFPYVYPFTQPVGISKAIVLVRSPLDVIVSLF